VEREGDVGTHSVHSTFHCSVYIILRSLCIGLLGRRWTNYAVQLSHVVVSYRRSNIILGGNCLIMFRSIRGTVASRNGEGNRPSGRLYGSDHPACIDFGHCGRKESCVSLVIDCSAVHFVVCHESCLHSTDKCV
jgi:hypothetical protein